MGNCGYIKVKNDVTEKRVTELLKEIIERRFFNIIKWEKNEFGWRVWFPVKLEDEINWQMEFWLLDNGELEFAHRMHLLPVWWLEWEIENELAFALNSKITDDGFNGSVVPVKNKYPSFDDYINRKDAKGKLRLDLYARLERKSAKLESLLYPKEVKSALDEIKNNVK